MSQFEFLAISVSILISMATARIVSGLPHALCRERRSALHVGWMVLWIFFIVISWWSIWSFHKIEWTFPKFLVFLSPAGPLLFIAYTLVPDNPEKIGSWEEHFFSVRRRFFGSMTLFFATTLMNQIFLRPEHGISTRTPFTLFLIVMSLVGFFSARPMVHGRTLVLMSGFIVALATSMALVSSAA